MTPPDDNNSLSISIIDTNDYNAISQCTFDTDGDKTLINGITPQGMQQIMVGPPQPITGVSCYGMCVSTYGECYDANRQYFGPCCNGYCSATRCQPWV
ncbi:uncharacterized protein BCR38DRAFT_441035 [Pseudomassariella vexata]|uniref:Uncharacterized protein n=1 Tax=Pseudomassariella vexata TaxID=1141098 RepID=A0A1Y2DR60_9PEZI|nr:uncharacterized protein BCR38DRAFT_441035 [Pseudomassariella vexata]ORY61751.1 hypothetical protein BCR38DRAFT_441035 [Pseudomassariella vexata]